MYRNDVNLKSTYRSMNNNIDDWFSEITKFVIIQLEKIQWRYLDRADK